MAELGLPPLETLSADEARAFLEAMAARAAARTRGRRDRRRRARPAPAGDLAYRLYRPATPGPHPVVVYFHGGGWVLGSQDSDDPLCRDLCVRSDAVIVSVNYRHAPEARFPAAVDDALRRAAVGGRQRRGARRSPRASWPCAAGARAATSPRSCCQLARDAGGPAIAGQVLLTPVDRLRPDAPVVRRERRRLHPDDRADARGSGTTTPTRPTGPTRRPSPLRAADLSNLPPALIVTVRVRPAARRGRGLRRGPGRGRQRGPPRAVPGPHPHVAHHGRRRRCRAPASGPRWPMLCRGCFPATVPG